MATNKLQSLWVWILPGLAGLLIFFLLRSEFDFMAGAPVTSTKEHAVQQTRALLTELGHEPDTLGIIPYRNQRVSLYSAIRDSLGEATPSPSSLNRQSFHLHGWEVVAASPLSLNDSFNLTSGSLFNASGLSRVRYDLNDRLKYFELNTGHAEGGVLLGEKNRAFAEKLITEVFEFTLDDYSFMDTEGTEFTEPGEQPPTQIEIAEEEPKNTFRWSKSNGLYTDYIELELESAVHRETDGLEQTEIHGVRVLRFEAYNEIEKIPVPPSEQNFVVFFFIVISLLALIVFIEGLGQLFKGKADWKRILAVAVLIATLIYGWRFIFMLNFNEVLTTQANLVVQFNQLIFGVVMGIFAAIAYIGWEAYARGEKSFQIQLIDAFWRGRFFLKESGAAIIRGFSLGGVLLGIIALFLTFYGLYFFQSDSQFGFSEIVNRPFFLSLNMSVLSVAAIASIAMVGIIYNFFDKRIRNGIISMTLAIVLGGLVLAGLGRSFGTDGTIYEDAILFTLLAIPIFFAYKFSGVVTVFSGLWLLTTITNILPYFGSPSLSVSMLAWPQVSLAGGILLFGIIAYLKAPPITSINSYIPEYEKKQLRNLRFENEMQIARNTQEKLMPLKHPETEQFELYGYFIPSYEVGGDYFDYVTHQNGDGSEAVTLTVVDVSGKSMRAAMHAVFTSGLLRSRMYTDTPAKILREISPVIFEKTDAQTFITCLVARFEPANSVLTVANAGHCLPIVKRNGKAEFLQMPDPRFPLGVKNMVEYSDMSIQLEPGDVVLFYSDGFPEAVNEKGDRIGFDRTLEIVKSMDTDGLSAREICDKIRRFIKDFSIERLADDTTILCLKIK